ncbi:MAG: class I SAM-dependent methyltransferase [Pseudomonadota bacterium]
MDDFTATSFGEIYAERYDEEHDPGTTDEAVACLHDLSGGKPTLELAIGTGRLALPLVARGLSVSGIEASPAMIKKLQAKPLGNRVNVTVGDIAEVRLGRRFGFAFLAFNTLFNLRTQAAQLACFQRTAEHLEPGACFLVEALVPELRDFSDEQRLRVLTLDQRSLRIEAAVHDPVEQTILYQRVHLGADGVRIEPLPIRYAWPQEIDLMARLAGFNLVDRWGDWHRGPFTATSRSHCSLYRLAESG